MVHGPILILILLLAVCFIVLATSVFKLHPFLALLFATYGIGFAAGMATLDIATTITAGFGNILAHIGLVIIIGTIIGTILEKTGAAITMADTVLKFVGKRRPALAMSLIGYIVSIPVFCDSGFIILNSLKRSMSRRTKTPGVTMSVALATGLYATHTLVPPTPGPIAAAGNLNLNDQIGLVIIVGIFVSLFAVAAAYIWAMFAGKRYTCKEDFTNIELEGDARENGFAELPSPIQAFAPIFVPIILIAIGTLANFPVINTAGETEALFGTGVFFEIADFLGRPINALVIGFLLSLTLFPSFGKETMTGWIQEGLGSAATIIMITGVGGSLGAVLKATPIGEYLGQVLEQYNLGIFLPFIIAAALKTAQGSSTVALVTTSALVSPLLETIGLGSVTGRVLTVMAIGAGAMTVSHANDSFFWVVTEYSGMQVDTAYKSQTMATLVQGCVTIGVVAILAAIFV